MTNQHPNTPSPELFTEWLANSIQTVGKKIPEDERGVTGLIAADVAIQAARWGADTELEACLQWFSAFYCMETWMQKDLEKFRVARRPKPLSLKEQALDVLSKKLMRCVDPEGYDTIRRALEQLDD
jgi:hypothetical protein